MGYGQTRTYLTGQKTGNRIQGTGLISLGPGTAGISSPMQKYSIGCVAGIETASPFRFYYGDQSILTGLTSHYAKLTAARTLGALGLLGSGADVYIQFRNNNNNFISANTPTYFKLKEAPLSTGINLELGKLLGIVPLMSISGRGYKNSLDYKFHSGEWGFLCSNPYDGNENIGELAGTNVGTKTRLLIDALGEWYVAVIPDEDYNSVRLSVTYPPFDVEVLSANSEINVNVYHAFTETSGSSCSVNAHYTSPGEATGINLNTGVLGLNLSNLIANPHYVINDNPDQYASYSSGVLDLGVANTVSQTIYFDHTASEDDGVKVKLALKNDLIGVDLVKLQSVKFLAYKGTSEISVWEEDLEGIMTLLGLKLLDLINLGSDHKELELAFKPGTEFDRIKIEFDQGLLNLGVITDALRVYHVSLAPSVPQILAAGQPNDISVCEGETASFEINAAGESLSYQWQFWDGTIWQDISEAISSTLQLTNVPLSDNQKRYRVKIVGGNISCPQTIFSQEATLSVKLASGKPHVTITDIIN